VAVIVVRTPHHLASRSNDVARVVTPAPAQAALAVERPRVVPKRLVKPHALRPKPLPKLEQFPAPTPMTAEERALLAFVEQHPAEARQVFADLQKSDEPIEIQPIQIPPLQSDGAE
jgi:hypothetical protein